MPRKRQPEAELQHTVCEHLEARASPGLVWWHCPNGGARSAVEAAIMVGLGVKRGVPDLHFLKGGRFYVMELKAPGRKLTAEQGEMIARLADAGAQWAVTDNLDTALTWLEAHGLIRGKTNVAQTAPA